MKIVVDPKKYAYFSYSPYLDRSGNETATIPTAHDFKAGDVVYHKEHHSLGVVLGCICDRELRTDMDGMVCIENLVHATPAHFKMESVSIGEDLMKESGF